MTLARRALRRLRRLWHGKGGYTYRQWDREERLAYLEQVVEYLRLESSRQSMLLRHVTAPVIHDLPQVRQTKESFDYQWAAIPAGVAMLDNQQFRAQATSFVTRFTALPAEWFRGKRAIDAGCGNGRYSWALCRLGAAVLSLDQSEHGLRQTADVCREFPAHRTMKVDLLQPVPISERADLVWSFGVLHHTGDTYRAFRHIAPLVAPGGYLFMMIYGEPRPYAIDDFIEVNEYASWGRRTANLELPAKLEAIRAGMAAGELRMVGEEFVNGYFDAISPPINDLHTFEEVESWLLEAGFTDIRRTIESRNHHVVGRRPRD